MEESGHAKSTVPSKGARTRPAIPSLLRTLNDRAALDLFLQHGRLSRVDIARMAGVSKPTASQLLARLEDAHLVMAVGLEGGRSGRAAQQYELNPRFAYAAALDVTEHHIDAALADVTGRVIAQVREKTPRRRGASGPQQATAALNTTLKSAKVRHRDVGCVVMAVAGAHDVDTDHLRYAKHLSGWQGVQVIEELEALTAIPFIVENDVNLAALAERRVGAARNVSDFFLFWVDEGIGGALVIDDKIHRGGTGSAGEMTFLQVPGIDVVRNPVRGNVGGFEELVGEASLLALARSLGIEGGTQVEIVSTAVTRDDPNADGFLNEIASRYAIGLSSVIAVVDPSAIILAGSVMAAGGSDLRARIEGQLLEVAITVPAIHLSTVPDNPVLAGALCASLDRTRDLAFTT